MILNEKKTVFEDEYYKYPQKKEQISMDFIIKKFKNKEINYLNHYHEHNIYENVEFTMDRSNFIESIILNLPLKPFYFLSNKNIKDNLSSIGYIDFQRLHAIYRFIFTQSYKLSGLNILEDLNGKTYESLTRKYKRSIEECPITIFIINGKSSEDLIKILKSKIDKELYLSESYLTYGY